MSEEAKKRGGWPPGTSGNPAGRPKGSGDGTSGNPAGRPVGRGEVAALRAHLGTHLIELLDRTLLQALAGDPTATKLILERVLPPLKAQAATIQLEFSASTIVDQGQAILQAVLDGRIAPDIGAQLISSLGALGALKNATELEEKLRALEGLA